MGTTDAFTDYVYSPLFLVFAFLVKHCRASTSPPTTPRAPHEPLHDHASHQYLAYSLVSLMCGRRGGLLQVPSCARETRAREASGVLSGRFGRDDGRVLSGKRVPGIIVCRGVLAAVFANPAALICPCERRVGDADGGVANRRSQYRLILVISRARQGRALSKRAVVGVPARWDSVVVVGAHHCLGRRVGGAVGVVAGRRRHER